MENSQTHDSKAGAPATLGDVLYGGNTDPLVTEAEWVTLIHFISERDARSLHALYERIHKVVFTLALQITNDRATADDVTVDVFHEIWREAYQYDPSQETVVAWIMKRTRSQSLQREGLERRHRARKPSGQENALVELLPSPSVWVRLESRIWADTGVHGLFPHERWQEPLWKEVASGIFCKLLATDYERDRVSMLVRLAPGVDYPPHRHAGVEELHLLHGELMIDDRKVYPGDYNRAEPGSCDSRVWSETGCSCVLITSIRDQLGN